MAVGVNIPNVGLMFTRYLDRVDDTMNHASRSRQLVNKEDKWTGSHNEWRVHTRRGGAFNWSEDGGSFPAAKKQGYKPAKSYRKFLHAKIQLTNGVMAACQKSKSVAKDVITSEVEGIMRDILKGENGMFFRDGTGAVCQIEGAAGTQGGNPSSTTTIDVDDARMLWEDQEYDVYDNSTFSAFTATKHGTVTVSTVTEAPRANGTFQVTFTGNTPAGLVASAATDDVGDYLVWKDSYGRVPTGLDLLVDDAATTFQNIDVSANPRYASLVLGNSGTKRALTPGLFRKMLAGLSQKTGQDNPSGGLTVLCDSWQAINVEELYEGELRLTPETKKAGIAVASFQSSLGKIDILTDTDALHNKMFFVDFSKIYRRVQKKLGWIKQGGEIFMRSDDAAFHTAVAEEICEYDIAERHTSGKIEDLEMDPSTAY